jgi:hypothetical protein
MGVMVVRLRVASRWTLLLLAKWVAAWRAACSQVEGASTEAQAEPEAEAHAVKAWKSIDQLS